MYQCRRTVRITNVPFSFIYESNYDIKSKKEDADRVANRTIGKRKGVADTKGQEFGWRGRGRGGERGCREFVGRGAMWSGRKTKFTGRGVVWFGERERVRRGHSCHQEFFQ